MAPKALFYVFQYCEFASRAVQHLTWKHRVRYGPAPKNTDTAINVLLDVVQDQSGKTYKMDHYATRYPTNVVDIADFLVRLTGECNSIDFPVNSNCEP